MRRFLITVLLLAGLVPGASAQFGCFDSTLIQPGVNCPNGLQNYNPVCACNGETYNNSCIAEKTAGIPFQNLVEGPCGDFDFYFTPNTVSYQLEYNYFSKTNGIVNLFIYDPMGQVKYTYREPVQIAGYVVRDRYIDTSFLEPGIYLLLILKDGNQQVKKFFKGNPF